MGEQLIITLDREFASGGRIIARRIADAFDIRLLDGSIIQEIADIHGLDVKKLSGYDEVPKSIFGARTVRGYSSSPHVNIAKLQFDFILEKAKSGESFIVLGRCGESVLSEYKDAIKLFIMANAPAKIKRVMDFENVSEDEAYEIIRVNNKKRRDYHNYYCNTKWGDSRRYDMCINTSRLGIEPTADFLIEYIKARISNAGEKEI